MADRPSVLTIGTWDLVHFGQIEFLQWCRKLGEVMVGVNTDEFAATFKTPPVMTITERRHALGLLGFPTRVNDGPGRDLIDYIRPDILAVGSDWARKDYFKQIDVTQDWLDEQRIILAYIPYAQTLSISATELKRRIRAA